MAGNEIVNPRSTRVRAASETFGLGVRMTNQQFVLCAAVPCTVGACTRGRPRSGPPILPQGTALQGPLEQALFNPQPVGDIAGGVGSAYGLFLDRHETLYVSNWGNDKVTVYPRRATEPEITYAKELSRPLYAIDDDRDVYVGNADNGDIIVFKKGNTEPIGFPKVELKIANSLRYVQGMAVSPPGELDR